MSNIEPGNISNENAEARANLGSERKPAFTEAQAFDGPAPETINVSHMLFLAFDGTEQIQLTGHESK